MGLGQTFSNPKLAFSLVPYDRSDTYASGGSARACGSLGQLCLSGFTFPRTQTLPDAAADSSGNLYVSYEQLRPAVDNGDTYHPTVCRRSRCRSPPTSASAGRV